LSKTHCDQLVEFLEGIYHQLTARASTYESILSLTDQDLKPNKDIYMIKGASGGLKDAADKALLEVACKTLSKKGCSSALCKEHGFD